MPEVATKLCSRCGLTSPITEFPWKHEARGIRRSWCRSCQRAYAHQHYLRNIDRYKAKARKATRRDRMRLRQRVDDFLGTHPCIDCGESDISVLEFDHRDPAQKRMPVSRLASIAGWTTVLMEIGKCDVRCANCHRRRTARQFDWAKTKQLARPGPERPVLIVERLDSNGADFLRECSSCQWLKPLSEFAFRSAHKRTLNDRCRKCHATYRRQHYLRHRDRYFSQANAQTRRNRADKLQRLREFLLNHPCVDCGETEVATLEFDHVDPSTKLMEVGRIIRHRNWSAVQDEIAKCVVRCANCHRRRTIAQQVASREAGHLVEFAAARE